VLAAAVDNGCEEPWGKARRTNLGRKEEQIEVKTP
jgi:hypothetical protein